MKIYNSRKKDQKKFYKLRILNIQKVEQQREEGIK